MNQQEKLTEALNSLENYKERRLVPPYFLNALTDIRAVLATMTGGAVQQDPNARLRDLITLVCDAAFACGDCDERDDVTYKPLFEAEQVAITNLKNYVATIRCSHTDNPRPATTPPAAPVVARELDESTMEWALGELADGWITMGEREGPHGFYQNARRALNAIAPTPSPVPETRCVKCRHTLLLDCPLGELSQCRVSVTTPDGDAIECGCKCEFTAVPETPVGGEARHHKHCSIWTVTTDGKKNPCDCICECTHSMFQHIRPGEDAWYEDCAVDLCPCMKFVAAPVAATADNEGDFDKPVVVDGACLLCEKGFPIEKGVHYGTQALGMIPSTWCAAALRTPVEGRDGD